MTDSAPYIGRPRCAFILPLVSACLLACAPPPRRIPLTEQNKILAPDGSENDHFGVAVAIQGDRILVGARGNDQGGAEAGAAYVFKRGATGWALESKLVATGGKPNERFGIGVGLDGDRAIVGARGDFDRGMQSGAAYIFRNTGAGWVQERRLISTEAIANDHFGASVAIFGDRAAIGAPGGASGSRLQTGAVYIYRRTSLGWWEQEARLVAHDGEARDHFGFSVALDGTTVIVGAHGDDDRGTRAGAAYIFEHTDAGWRLGQKLAARDGRGHDFFGQSVAVHGDYALVGAYGVDSRGRDVGAAYIFERTPRGWVQQGRLIAGDRRASDHFGSAVAIHGGRAVVGARGHTSGKSRSGAAYLFWRSRDGWALAAKLVAGDATELHFFGQSVAIDEARIAIGANGDNARGPWSGSAYVYEMPASDSR